MASKEPTPSPLSVNKGRKKKKIIVKKTTSKSTKQKAQAGPRLASPQELLSPTDEKLSAHKDSPQNASTLEAQHTMDEYLVVSPKSKSNNGNNGTSPVYETLPETQPVKTQGEASAEVRIADTSLVTKNTEQKTKKKVTGQKALPSTSVVHRPGTTSNRRNKKKSSQPTVDKRQPGITDHFYVRRSSRKCAATVKEEERRKLEEDVLSGKEDGLEIRTLNDKGRGVFSTKAFRKGEMVCEYAGELITYDEAKSREQKYQERPDEIGCYMYYFNFRNKKYCVDATAESDRLGRLLNHSRSASNVVTKQICIKETPHLILVAGRDISIGEELLYDYGERNQEAISSHPWLNS